LHPAVPEDVSAKGREAADHARAAADHVRAAPDHARKAADKARAARDHARAARDHVRAAPDRARAAVDHARENPKEAADVAAARAREAADVAAAHAPVPFAVPVFTTPDPEQAAKDAAYDAVVEARSHGYDPSKMALHMACDSYYASLNVLRSAQFARQAIKNFMGFYTMILAFKTLFPASFAVIDGISSAVENVKEVLPSSSTPGYILLSAVLAFLPAFLLIMAILSQLFAAPAVSLALFFLSCSIVMTGHLGYMMTLTASSKDVTKRFNTASMYNNIVKTVAGVILVAWAAYLIYVVSAGGPTAEELRKFFDSINLDDLKDSAPFLIIQMIARFIMFRCLTLVIFTDLLMISVFDAADDELQVDNDSGMMETKSQLLTCWQAIHPPTTPVDEAEKKNREDRRSLLQELRFPYKADPDADYDYGYDPNANADAYANDVQVDASNPWGYTAAAEDQRSQFSDDSQ